MEKLAVIYWSQTGNTQAHSHYFNIPSVSHLMTGYRL